ncbi:MAG: hypothetical protein CMK59_10840 [Proteobacteria bacterium]|nr:hypothetical protein [Pseudomonadota bacterium]
MSSPPNQKSAEIKMAQAESLLKSAKQLDSPNDQEARILLEQNIIALLDEAQNLDPHNSNVYRRRAIAFAFQKDFDSAWSEACKAQSLDPSNPEIYRLMAHLLKMCGNIDAGIAYLLALSQTPLLLSPILHLTLIELRLCRATNDDIKKSVPLLQMLLEAPIFELRMQLRLWKELPREFSVAGIQKIRENLSQQPPSEKDIIFGTKGLNKTQSLALCELSIKEIQDNVHEQNCYPIIDLWEAQNALSTLFLERGDLQQALNWIEQAQSIAPKTASVQLTKNCVLLSQGKTASAISGFKRLASAPFVLGSIRKRSNIMLQISGLTAHMTNH